MKALNRLVIFFFLASFPGVQLLALESTSDSLFSKANSLYDEGSYEQAQSVYLEILDRGEESADLYYNMGNTAYRTNSIGYAILYYEKALKLKSSHQDAAHNLDYVSRYRLDSFEELPGFFLSDWKKALIRLFPERTWSGIALIFAALLLSTMLYFLFSSRARFKKLSFIFSLIFLLLLFISLGSARVRHREIVNPEQGIVLVPSVIVRSSPSTTGTELFILHEGSKIEIREDVAGWQNIRLKDGREGWIARGDFASI